MTTVEIAARIDNLTLWSDNRTLAVMDRDRFKRWVRRPDQLLEIDDVTWSIQDSTAWISIDGSVFYAIPKDAFEYLKSVL